VYRSLVPAALAPAGVVTVTSTVPDPAGAVAVTCVGLSSVNPAAGFPPKLTAVAPAKPVPVIATAVPPASGPDLGLSDDTTGAAAGAGVKVTVAIAVAIAENPFWSTPLTVTVSVCDAPATPMNSPVNEHD
jgi:hypothetical protein